MKVAIIYSTMQGHTKKISHHIGNILNEKAYDVDYINLDNMQDFDISDYDKIIIGASIRYGKFRKNLFSFINKYTNELNSMPSFLFTVNLVARKANKDSAETNVYTRKLLNKINWQPKDVAVFAGEVCWSKYSWWQTKIIQLIMVITKGPTDTSVDMEFTDWNNVTNFAAKID